MHNVTDLHSWIGKEQIHVATIDHHQAMLISNTLGVETPPSGAPLPGLWHWCWFTDALPASELGRDGHSKKGGFLPPVPLPRRMWAGGQIEFLRPIEIGVACTKRSTIVDVQEKQGRSGSLCIVTVKHELSVFDELCLVEHQNLVYREDPKGDGPTASPPLPPANPMVSRTIVPDPILMFRYSALTFNGHRIHYDVDYARDVEGYRDLVFHAPLSATLLHALATEMADGNAISRFSYRATSPVFCNEDLKFCGRIETDKIVVWTENSEGHQAMIAEAQV
ncbi:MAG: MaoC family dehydratase N-terminal domain-containing protein [Pseudomonadota bacterium]